MSNSVSRIALTSHQPLSEAPASAPRNTPQAKGPQDASAPLKKFVISQPLNISSQAPVISPAQHQALRRRLFDKLVRQVLNTKGHPFDKLDRELKQDMVNSITEELVHSHLKI